MVSPVNFRYFVNMVKISLNKIKIKAKLRQWKRNKTHITERNKTIQKSEYFVLWHIDPLLRLDSLNNRRCYGAPAAHACAVTSHNRRGNAGSVFCRSAPRLYDWADRVLLRE
jgi:hypothetical protein